MSAGAGLAQDRCGGCRIGIRAVPADIDLDQVFALLGMGMHVVVITAIGPARPGIVMGVCAVVNHNVVTRGNAGRDDGTKKDYCKKQIQELLHRIDLP